MSDRNLLRERELERRRNEIVTSHYVAAAVLLVAAAGFLTLILAFSRVFDFDRFAY
jgi:ABC-type amino acid transport system permease subunit